MSYSRTSYTGPVKNRGEDDQGRALVSREELADFRRKYGADKTLRDLLNVDRSGKLPEVSSERDMRARGVQGANISPAKDEGAPASRPRASLSDVPGLIARGMAEGADRVPAGRGLGAAFTAAGAARGAGAAAQGALARREAASAAAEAERLASRVEPRMRRSGESVEESVKQARAEMAREPRMRRSGESVEESAKQARAEMAREPRMRRSGESVDESVSQARAEMAREPRMRRSGEGVEEATKQARMDMAREPRLEPARALSAAERKPPAVQGDKAGMTPRSRTRETDEGVEFKKGGKVKAYAKGGSVKGSGCEQRGLRKCKVY